MFDFFFNYSELFNGHEKQNKLIKIYYFGVNSTIIYYSRIKKLKNI